MTWREVQDQLVAAGIKGVRISENVLRYDLPGEGNAAIIDLRESEMVKEVPADDVVFIREALKGA